MKKAVWGALMISLGTLLQIPVPLLAQSESGTHISGYTRATGYLGLPDGGEPDLKSLYGETSLKVKAKAGSRGLAFTDLRFRGGSEWGSSFTRMDLREAYLDLFLGKVEFRMGKQISPWGRADGWNPTDNLTPSDYFVRSPEPDDMRTGSYRIRGRYNPTDWLRIELNWAPWYVPSTYRFDQTEIPDFVSISDPIHPGFNLKKTTLAGKLDLIFPIIEGSISWFSGYDPLPALKPGVLPTPPFSDFTLELLQVPFRQQTFGGDFATAILNTGLRGEVALKIPEQGDSADPYLPKKDLQWVVSIDREFGPLRIIAGYTGRYVFDFVPADAPGDFDLSLLENPAMWPYLGSELSGRIGYFNRILYDQTDEISHSVMISPSVSLLHESLLFEFTALCNLTTEEYLIYPKLTWTVTDGLSACAGYQYYEGKANTRFSWIRSAFNGPFLECRLTF